MKNYDPEFEQDTKTRLLVEGDVMIRCAGIVAVEKLKGKASKRDWSGASDDLGNAFQLLDYFSGKERIDKGIRWAGETKAYGEWLYLRTEGFINDPFWWAAVQGLAKELLIQKEFKYRKARTIIKNAIVEHSDLFHAKEP